MEQQSDNKMVKHIVIKDCQPLSTVFKKPGTHTSAVVFLATSVAHRLYTQNLYSVLLQKTIKQHADFLLGQVRRKD